MLNAEKYRDEVLKMCEEDADFAVYRDTKKIVSCSGIDCTNCIFEKGSCSRETLKWLLSEYKEPVMLTQDEYDFCRLLGYGYLTRNHLNKLCLHEKKPIKHNGMWSTYVLLDVSIFKQLGYNSFHFIKHKDKESYSVKEMLDNCIIIDKDKEEMKITNED